MVKTQTRKVLTYKVNLLGHAKISKINTTNPYLKVKLIY